MSKYAPLGDFLRRQKTALVPMTFTQIEQVVGSKLPKSQRYPAWWSNNRWNNVMTQIWLDAGFETEQVDVVGRRLVFRKVGKSPGSPGSAGGPNSSGSAPPLEGGNTSTRHPLIGWLAGSVQVAPGVDLTAPADPDWGDGVPDAANPGR